MDVVFVSSFFFAGKDGELTPDKASIIICFKINKIFIVFRRLFSSFISYGSSKTILCKKLMIIFDYSMYIQCQLFRIIGFNCIILQFKEAVKTYFFKGFHKFTCYLLLLCLLIGSPRCLKFHPTVIMVKQQESSNLPSYPYFI